jgi:hypothetical protein
MKSIIKFSIFTYIFLLSSSFYSQNSGISRVYSFDIQKKITPPLLTIDEVKFIDEDNNNAINANEHCKIEFKVTNSGKGDGLNLLAKVSANGNKDGLSFLTSQNLSKIDKLGGSKTFTIEIISNSKTIDGNIEFNLEIIEPNGFNSDKINIKVSTRKLLEPILKVVECIVFSGNHETNLELKKSFSVQLLIQNIGQGTAKNTSLKLKLPENVYITSGDEVSQLKDMAPNETRSLIFELITNSKYNQPTIILKADLTESMNINNETWTKTLALNQSLAQKQIQVEAKSENKITIETASLISDVDKNIPNGLPLNSKKWALFIGCEDYTKYQKGLDKEINVDFAANDAIIFAEYAEKILGYPKDQIKILIDPTGSQIKQGIEGLKQSIKIENGAAEVLFYYSGHGLPDEETKQPYLIPVDVNGNNPKDGISLNELYSSLAKYESKKVTVILDACFSGGARNKELLANKGVKVKPRTDAVPGNILVMSSSQGTESSAVYREKQHGYFTYFLLKNLQETNGNETFGSCFDDVKYRVGKEVIKINKTQTPDIIIGSKIENTWKSLSW